MTNVIYLKVPCHPCGSRGLLDYDGTPALVGPFEISEEEPGEYLNFLNEVDLCCCPSCRGTGSVFGNPLKRRKNWA
jgi:hypothetical protein